MESRIRIKECYCKIRDRIKGSLKKGMHCNWPELSTYCGCCTLSTGIYIRSVIMIVLTITTIGVNGSVLQFLYSIGSEFETMNITEIDESWDPATDWDTLHFIYRAIVIYYILWICFKVVYIFIVVWTIYAVFRKNTKMLRILLFISIPNLVLEFFLSLAGSRLLTYGMRTLLVVCIISEIYNILAMRSEYKKIKGTSRIVPEQDMEEINPNNLASPSNENLRFQPERSQAHCRSCTCYYNEILNPQDDTNNVQTEPTVETGENIERNTNNISLQAHNNTISNNNCVENNRRTNNYNVSETSTNVNSASRAVRPNTLNILSNNENRTKMKVELSDDPVIYDKRQLNVGTSPIFDDMPII